MWHSRVFYMRLNDCNTVILQIVVNIDVSHAEVLVGRFMYGLLVPGKKPKHLKFERKKINKTESSKDKTFTKRVPIWERN